MKTLGIIFVLAIMSVLAASAAEARYQTQPNIRVLHASPDAPAVDILLDGALGFENLAFGDITDYASVPRGTYDVSVVATGTTSPSVIDAELRLKPIKDYTVIAVDYLNQITPIVLEDGRYRVTPFRSMVRFVHASPDAPAVDVAVAEGPMLFSHTEFKEAEKYIRLLPGEYDLEVRLAGTDTVVLEVNDVVLEPGTSYTAFALGEAGSGTLSAKLVEDRVSPYIAKRQNI